MAILFCNYDSGSVFKMCAVICRRHFFLLSLSLAFSFANYYFIWNNKTKLYKTQILFPYPTQIHADGHARTYTQMHWWEENALERTKTVGVNECFGEILYEFICYRILTVCHLTFTTRSNWSRRYNSQLRDAFSEIFKKFSDNSCSNKIYYWSKFEPKKIYVLLSYPSFKCQIKVHSTYSIQCVSLTSWIANIFHPFPLYLLLWYRLQDCKKNCTQNSCREISWCPKRVCVYERAREKERKCKRKQGKHTKSTLLHSAQINYID